MKKIVKHFISFFYSDAQLQSITTETVEKYIKTKPARMQAVFKAKGGNFCFLCVNKDYLVVSVCCFA